MRCFPFLLLVAVVVSVSCTAPPAEEVVREVWVKDNTAQNEADIQAIKENAEKFAVAVDAGDVEGLVAMVTDDLIWMVPNQPALVGKEAYRSLTQAAFEEYPYENSECVAVEVRLAGDWAYARGTWTSTRVPTSGDEPFPESGNWSVISDRQPDGSWKRSRVMYVSELPISESTE